MKKDRNCKICIQGLIDQNKISDISEDDIKEYFKGYGSIDSIEIPRDHITQKPKGYAIIEFSKSREAVDAVSALNGFDIGGKILQV